MPVDTRDLDDYQMSWSATVFRNSKLLCLRQAMWQFSWVALRLLILDFERLVKASTHSFFFLWMTINTWKLSVQYSNDLNKSHVNVFKKSNSCLLQAKSYFLCWPGLCLPIFIISYFLWVFYYSPCEQDSSHSIPWYKTSVSSWVLSHCFGINSSEFSSMAGICIQ